MSLQILHSTRGIRPDDLPMTGKVTRESKRRNVLGFHRYVLTLRFRQSRRLYGDEIIHAVDMRRAKQLARRMFPNARIK